MSIPKKGSRLITVDGVQYRWAVKQQDDYYSREPRSILTLVLEQIEKPRTTLLMILSEPFTDRTIALTPKYVAAVIRQAVKLGWKSDIAGPAFWLNSSDLPSVDSD